jgi:hypothetical protein
MDCDRLLITSSSRLLFLTKRLTMSSSPCPNLPFLRWTIIATTLAYLLKSPRLLRLLNPCQLLPARLIRPATLHRTKKHQLFIPFLILFFHSRPSLTPERASSSSVSSCSTEKHQKWNHLQTCFKKDRFSLRASRLKCFWHPNRLLKICYPKRASRNIKQTCWKRKESIANRRRSLWFTFRFAFTRIGTYHANAFHKYHFTALTL